MEDEEEVVGEEEVVEDEEEVVGEEEMVVEEEVVKEEDKGGRGGVLFTLSSRRRALATLVYSATSP